MPACGKGGLVGEDGAAYRRRAPALGADERHPDLSAENQWLAARTESRQPLGQSAPGVSEADWLGLIHKYLGRIDLLLVLDASLVERMGSDLGDHEVAINRVAALHCCLD
jgi:hypothetical protein